MWRVGNGSTIRVYWDKWLPGKFPSMIKSPRVGAPGDVRVDSLINQDTKQWDLAKIDLLFLPFEAAKIKSILLCFSNQADCMVWPRCRDGLYSVKTGYQLLCEMDTQNRASGSDSSSYRGFWRRLWKMRVPNKIKMFLWRACTDALPTRCNLVRRKVLDDPTCSMCGTGAENTMHALWECKQLLTV